MDGKEKKRKENNMEDPIGNVSDKSDLKGVPRGRYTLQWSPPHRISSNRNSNKTVKSNPFLSIYPNLFILLRLLFPLSHFPPYRSMKISLLFTLFWIAISPTLVASDASDHRYSEGDPVPLYANKVGPFHNPRYYLFRLALLPFSISNSI